MLKRTPSILESPKNILISEANSVVAYCQDLNKSIQKVYLPQQAEQTIATRMSYGQSSKFKNYDCNIPIQKPVLRGFGVKQCFYSTVAVRATLIGCSIMSETYLAGPTSV